MENRADPNFSETCPFCRIVDQPGKPRLVYEDAQVLAFEDIRPQAPLHILVIPRRHVKNVLELREEDTLLAGRLLLVANQIARSRGIDGAGFRLVINCNDHGGQTVGHLHLHLLGGRRMGWPPG